VPYAIRPYRLEDFLTLWEIDQSCFPPGISYRQSELQSYIQRSSAFTLVAEQQRDSSENAQERPRRILGFIVGERTSRSTGHIITIDVRADARRSGLGSRLLDSAENEFRLRKCSAVRLETAVDNVGALSFYKRHGYTVIRSIPHYYSNGVDALLLAKNLHSRQSSG
jgi:[ribosomal protein S18]-alanine N-acetyltransferase